MKILTLVFLCFISVFPALAQESNIYAPGSSWRNEGAEAIRRAQRESIARQGFIKPEIIELSLTRASYMEGAQFGILMKVPDVVSGCWDVSPLEYESSFIEDNFFDVKVSEYKRTPIEVENVGFECPVQIRMSTALIPLDAQDLKDRNIRQIRFSNGTLTDRYNIAHSENGIALIPESMIVFKAQTLTGPKQDRMVLDFGKGGMVTLHVPMAKRGDDVAQALRNLAYRHLLTVSPDTLPTVRRDGSVSMTFEDQTGRVAARIGENGHDLLGEVMVKRPYDGPQGRGLTNVPLHVYVTEAGRQL